MRDFPRNRVRRVVAVVVMGVAAVVAGRAPAAAQLSPSMTIEPSDLPNWLSYVSITYENIPVEPQRLMGQCAASVLAGGSTLDNCRSLGYVTGDSGTVPAILYGGFRSVNGQLIDCTEVEGGCVVGIGVPDTIVDAYVRVTFPDPVGITLTPRAGITNGEAIRVDLTHLMPGVDYRVRQCDASELGDFFPSGYGCDVEGGVVVTAGPDGTASTTIIAKQRFEATSGKTLLCLPGACGLGVADERNSATVAWADLCMARPSCP